MNEVSMKHIRTFSRNGFRLDLWDLNARDEYGKNILHYALFDEKQPNGKGIVFEGSDFGCSPMHAVDSDATVASVLSFLSLGDGDTDKEYFDNYTEDQLKWRDSYRREELALIVIESEENMDYESMNINRFKVHVMHGEVNSIFRVFDSHSEDGFIKDYSLQTHGIDASVLAKNHAERLNASQEN